MLYKVEIIYFLVCANLINELNQITNVSSDYYNTIDKVVNMYNIPINKLKEKYKEELLDIIIDICNKYAFVKDYNSVKDMIIQTLKRTNIPNKKLKNKAEIIDYKNDIINDEYVFMLSFNQENIPIIYKDEDYISDNIKDCLLLDLYYNNYKIDNVLI